MKQLGEFGPGDACEVGLEEKGIILPWKVIKLLRFGQSLRWRWWRHSRSLWWWRWWLPRAHKKGTW